MSLGLYSNLHKSNVKKQNNICYHTYIHTVHKKTHTLKIHFIQLSVRSYKTSFSPMVIHTNNTALHKPKLLSFTQASRLRFRGSIHLLNNFYIGVYCLFKALPSISSMFLPWWDTKDDAVATMLFWVAVPHASILIFDWSFPVSLQINAAQYLYLAARWDGGGDRQKWYKIIGLFYVIIHVLLIFTH